MKRRSDDGARPHSSRHPGGRVAGEGERAEPSAPERPSCLEPGLIPASSVSEAVRKASVYSRGSKSRYTQGALAERNRRRYAQTLVVAVLAVVAALALAALVVVGAAFASIDRRMGGLPVEALREELAAQSSASAACPQDEGAAYVLVLGVDPLDIQGDAASAPRPARVACAVLARLGTSGGQTALVSLHPGTWCSTGDVYRTIDGAYAHGGPAEVARAVGAYAGVALDHVAVFDLDGLEAVGLGVGKAASDIPDTVDGASAAAVLLSFVDAFTALSPASQVAALSTASAYLTTDLSAWDLAGYLVSMRGLDLDDVYCAVNPTTRSDVGETPVEVTDEAAWRAVMERVRGAAGAR